mmetsp:Transcript_41711/g.110012  ORF Transcript_41711/g.110012 Transcript_41711/m.110012 type:complete len:480 (+) Transcript_41711:208-1647(+)
MLVLRCLEGCQDLVHGGLPAELGLHWQCVAQVARDLAVEAVRNLGLQEGQLFPLDLLLVVSSFDDGSVHGQGDGHTEHDHWRHVEVVDALHYDKDHRRGHLLEAAEHGRGADDGVDTGDRRREAEFSQDRADAAAEEPAQQHRRRERAPGHGQPCEAHVQREVRHEGQRARAEQDLAVVVAREEELHGAVRGVDEERGDGVVLTLWAVKPHVLQIGVPVVTTITRQRRDAGDDGAERTVGHGLQGHAESRVSHPVLLALAVGGHGEHQFRVARGDCAQEGREHHEDGQVSLRPLLVLWKPREDHKLPDFLVDGTQQDVGAERADRGGYEGAEGELDGPSGRRDLLKHVQQASDRGVEQHGHRTSATDCAVDARRVREPLLLHNDCGDVGGQVHPLLHVWHREPVAHEEGQIPADGHRRPFAAYGEPGRVGQDAREDADDQIAHCKETRHVATVPVALALRQAAPPALRRPAQDHNHADH